MTRLLFTASTLGLLAALPATAATITGWNQSNVQSDGTPADYETGESIVYDQAVPPTGSVPAGASTSGKIVFTMPEADTPGIKVQPESYTDTKDGIDLAGCLMTTSDATCTSPFQSGKRIKQVMTGLDPVDLVFDVDGSTETSVYQVFGRLINNTSKALAGFSLELGFGVGNSFVEATAQDGLAFSTAFSANPKGSGAVSTQFPFGLFGDAATNPNFVLDGFFDDARTGFSTTATETRIESTDIFGAYASVFGPWMTGDAVPEGLFWDFDSDPTTDALLMAWQIAPDLWELRRDIGETCDGTFCAPGVTLDTYFTGSYADVLAQLGGASTSFTTGGIEDLANLNLNYAISLGDLGSYSSFTLRTTVYEAPAVPLPPALPMAAAGFGLLGLLRRKRRA